MGSLLLWGGGRFRGDEGCCPCFGGAKTQVSMKAIAQLLTRKTLNVGRRWDRMWVNTMGRDLLKWLAFC
eukprot:2065852-Amphidinium_carterae.1